MINRGLTDKLLLGNLDAKREWGHAREYVKAMWAMLQQDEPDDYVICSGENHSVKEFCEKAFAVAGLDYRDYVKLSEKFLRPAEVDNLLGDSSKAKKKLGWKYDVSFNELVREMVESDLERLKGEEHKV